MKDNLLVILLLIPLVSLAILPSIPLSIPITINSNLWVYLVLISGFLSFIFLYSKASIILKILLVFCFLSCFFSRSPYLSFTSFISLVICAYYYLFSMRIKNWELVFKAAQAIFFLHIILVVMQAFGKDTLMNFGRTQPVALGLIANNMRSSSFIVILGTFLVCYKLLNIIPLVLFAVLAKSSGAILSIILGVVFYILNSLKGKKRLILVAVLLLCSELFILNNNFKEKILYGRLPVWKKTIQLSLKHPFFGWGLSTYRVIFPVICDVKTAGGYAWIYDEHKIDIWEYEGTTGKVLAWRQAHNDWLQIGFEIGLIGFGMLILMIGRYFYIFFKSLHTRQTVAVMSALVMLIGNMFIHFPSRMTQTVLIILMFMVYVEHILKGEIA